MKKLNLKNNIFLVAKKVSNNGEEERQLDYYLRLSDGSEVYAFTRNYSTVCYEACKCGSPVNKILYEKKENQAFMKLVKYLHYIMPYLVEYYDLGKCGITRTCGGV